jgi:O-antigen ligase
MRSWVLFLVIPASIFLERWEPIPEAERLFRALRLWVLYFILSAAWSVGEEDEVVPKALDLVVLLCALYVAVLGARSGSFFALLNRYLILVLLPFALISLVPVATGNLALLSGAPDEDVTRLSVLAGGNNTIARLYGAFLLIALSIAFTKRRIIDASPYLISLPILVILLILTGSRGAALGTTIGAIVLIGTQRRAIPYLLIVVAVAVIAFIVSPALRPSGHLVDIAEDRWLFTTLVERHDSGRVEIYLAGIEAWLRYPIFGGGLGSFSVLSPERDRYVHNLFLEVAQEGGVIGLTLFGYAAFETVRFTRLKANAFSVQVVAMLMMWLVSAMFSGEFYDSRNVFIFALLSVAASHVRVEGRDVEAGNSVLSTEAPNVKAISRQHQ